MEVGKRTLEKLIGNPEEYSLEGRIFNFVCVITILVMGYNVVFSFLVGLPQTGWICLGLFLIGFYIYYLARFQNKFVLALTIAGIVVSVMFGLGFFYSSGMIGSSLLTFTIILFLLLITAPSRHLVYWAVFNTLLVFGLLTVEYLYPESVVEFYPNRLAQTIDQASTYLINVLFLYFGTLFFTRAYKLEQKRVEERSVVLERLNQEKDKLFSIVSHDLRSPLASVQQYFQVLKAVELDSEERKKIEAELLDGISHTQEMLFNLLSWSTTQMKGTKVSLSSVNIYHCLESIIEIYKPLASNKDIRLDFRVDPSQHVLADAAMLQLIIRNLVGNAVKFTTPGGLVTIAAGRTDKNYLITVKDTGRGINDEDKEHVFSLKAQPTYGTNKERGVGLGLFLCKEYAEAQHGALWFESRVGVGTTFFLRLPVGESVFSKEIVQTAF
ncbi:hypothetical protein GCM10027347_20290 [Larkinella harenae]